MLRLQGSSLTSHEQKKTCSSITIHRNQQKTKVPSRWSHNVFAHFNNMLNTLEGSTFVVRLRDAEIRTETGSSRLPRASAQPSVERRPHQWCAQGPWRKNTTCFESVLAHWWCAGWWPRLTPWCAAVGDQGGSNAEREFLVCSALERFPHRKRQLVARTSRQKKRDMWKAP